MKTGIALIGFMGTGKTAVGKILAQRLDKDFIELDAMIEERSGKPVTAIFRDEGETGFRRLEIETTAKAARRKNAVIACGGGIVLNKISIERLAKNNVIVCLTASPAVILKRTGGDSRPLLNVEDRKSRIEELLKLRRPYYEQAAEIEIDTSRLTPEGVARKVMKRVAEYEDYGK
jgi:shikimate kinase